MGAGKTGGGGGQLVAAGAMVREGRESQVCRGVGGGKMRRKRTVT